MTIAAIELQLAKFARESFNAGMYGALEGVLDFDTNRDTKVELVNKHDAALDSAIFEKGILLQLIKENLK